MHALERIALDSQADVEDAVGFALPLTWDVGPYQHFASKRGFGVTFFTLGNHGEPVCHIRLSKKLLSADTSRQEGIIRHELGHVVDMVTEPNDLDSWAASQGVKLPPPKHAELRADAIAEAVWGEPLRYDRDTVQSTCCGVDKRPSHLGK